MNRVDQFVGRGSQTQGDGKVDPAGRADLRQKASSRVRVGGGRRRGESEEKRKVDGRREREW